MDRKRRSVYNRMREVNPLKKLIRIFIAVCCGPGCCWAILFNAADAQLRVVTYNTATSGENSAPSTPRPAVRDVLEGIGNESVNGIAKPIDILFLQEQAGTTTTTQSIADLLNDIHGGNSYRAGRVNGRSNGGGRNGIVYNSETVQLVGERGFGTLSSVAQARQTLRYQLRPIGYDDRSDIYAYVNHYKASNGTTDQARRNAEAVALRRNADSFPEGTNFIYAGDFNIRSCQEDMFQTLLSPGVGQAIDPMADFAAGCTWHNNDNFRGIHTQSPSDGSFGGLVQGGMDDRFDFQLVSASMFDEEGLSLIPGSYHAFGNNGTHLLNQAINNTRNTALPRATLDALAQASDHLPVVADYQLPAEMHVEVNALPSLVLRDTPLNVEINVSNSASVVHPLGADELDYTVNFTALGGSTTSQSGSVLAMTAADVVSVALPTDRATLWAFGLDVTTDSPGVVDDGFSQAGAYTVINPSMASFDSMEAVTQSSFDFGILPQSTMKTDLQLSLHNIAFGGAAALDLDSIAWSQDIAVWDTDLTMFDDLAPGLEQSFTVSLSTDLVGEFSNTLTLNVSDQDGVFGERQSTMSLMLSGRVAIGGDANLDDEVGFDDFLVLSQNFGLAGKGWGDGDFDGDGETGFVDFLVLSSNFGVSTQAVNLPEPNSFALLSLIASLLALRSQRQRRFACD